jgi:hypothetical protein
MCQIRKYINVRTLAKLSSELDLVWLLFVNEYSPNKPPRLGSALNLRIYGFNSIDATEPHLLISKRKQP